MTWNIQMNFISFKEKFWATKSNKTVIHGASSWNHINYSLSRSRIKDDGEGATKQEESSTCVSFIDLNYQIWGTKATWRGNMYIILYHFCVTEKRKFNKNLEGTYNQKIFFLLMLFHKGKDHRSGMELLKAEILKQCYEKKSIT